eukprot:16424463-Heterocapsa_arctica.AAC.1
MSTPDRTRRPSSTSGNRRSCGSRPLRSSPRWSRGVCLAFGLAGARHRASPSRRMWSSADDCADRS